MKTQLVTGKYLTPHHTLTFRDIGDFFAAFAGRAKAGGVLDDVTETRTGSGPGGPQSGC